MGKKLFFGSNLKMYKNTQETVDFLSRLVDNTKDISRDDIHLFIIPSYTTLEGATTKVDRRYVQIGAQNMCWEEKGQFTGEISPLMLGEMNIDLVMIGHSERRHVFRETDIEENKKVLCALEHGMTALLCIGETGEQKEYGISREILREQLIVGFHNVPAKYADHIWVAYEPVWSIGVNGTPASPDYAEEMHAVIHQTLEEIFGPAGRQIPALYGGSVNPGNASQLIVQPHIDGLFVGRAAWDADKFNALIRQAMKAAEGDIMADCKSIIQGQSHLGLPTHDVQATIDFYKQLGFEIEWQGRPDQSVFLKNGDCVLEVYTQDQIAEKSGAWDHVALSTPDIEAVYEYVKSLGYEALEGKICGLPFYSNGVRYFTILGPNQEKVEFSQKL